MLSSTLYSRPLGGCGCRSAMHFAELHTLRNLGPSTEAGQWKVASFRCQGRSNSNL